MVRFVRRGEKYGLVNDKNRVVVPFVFDTVEPFFEGYGVGTIDRFGVYLYNDDGKLALGQPFDSISRYGFPDDEEMCCGPDAHYVIRHQGQTCVLNWNLGVVVPWGKYDVQEHSAPPEGIWIIIDRYSLYGYAGRGRVIAPCQSENAHSFCNGYAVVKGQNQKWGMIDVYGDLVIPTIYDSMDYACSEGLIGAKKDGLYGFLDMNGNVVIPFVFKNVHIFRHGTATVETADGICRTIDHTGRFVDEVKRFEIPEGLRTRRVTLRKAREIADERKRRRAWFDGLEGHEFVIRRETEVGYLVHYAAPCTGSGTVLLKKGVRFKLRGKMNDAARYCSVVSGQEEEMVYKKECKKSYNMRGLAGRCSGISFFLTEGQLSGKNFAEV